MAFDEQVMTRKIYESVSQFISVGLQGKRYASITWCVLFVLDLFI